MSDVFISYARPDEPMAKRVADALRSAGYRVWRDDELPAHRAYAEVIEERLKGAKAVVVLWSADAAKSQWVRAEADGRASRRNAGPAPLDGTIPPLPFNQIQCADLEDWDGASGSPGLGKLASSIAALAGPRRERPRGKSPSRRATGIGLRASVRQHERRRRAGIFQRRHQRGHHHRFVEGLGARGHRPQHRLHVQGPVGRRLRGRPASSIVAMCSKAACARRAGECGSPRS